MAYGHVAYGHQYFMGWCYMNNVPGPGLYAAALRPCGPISKWSCCYSCKWSEMKWNGMKCTEINVHFFEKCSFFSSLFWKSIEQNVHFFQKNSIIFPKFAYFWLDLVLYPAIFTCFGPTFTFFSFITAYFPLETGSRAQNIIQHTAHFVRSLYFVWWCYMTDPLDLYPKEITRVMFMNERSVYFVNLPSNLSIPKPQ